MYSITPSFQSNQIDVTIHALDSLLCTLLAFVAKNNDFPLFPHLKIDSNCGPTQSCCPVVISQNKRATSGNIAPTPLGMKPTFITQHSPLSSSNGDTPPPAQEKILVCSPILVIRATM